MEKQALEKATWWTNNKTFDAASRQEIQDLIDSGDTKEITERFYKDLEFGTGGIRSILGAGLNRINIYTIRKASQAIADEILADHKESSPAKIAISYDSRIMSFELAKEAATVYAANGIHAYIYKRLNPVPLLSFSVRHHNANAGVMVTASHNPPAYNGYKVFWNDGAQVTPPNDESIIKRYQSLSDFAALKHMDFDKALADGLIHWVGEDVEQAYHDAIFKAAINPKLCLEHGSDLKIVYTPIHGSALIPCSEALAKLGFSNVSVVESQAKPDGKFPTVKSPNPENPEALGLAVEQMKRTGADIVMGSDPDGDRLGMAFIENGEVVYLNGNQIGTLMLHYILKNLSEQKRMPSNPYFVKTIVTTPLQENIAKAFNVECENTLTGFKWICGRMNEIERTQKERNFLFATEESFGYLNHQNVRDKDGVSSVTLMSEIALWYKKQNLSLVAGLDEIYKEYGFSYEHLLSLDYFGKEGADKIKRIMESFRSLNGEIDGRKAIKVEDYQKGMKGFPISNVLGYHFEDGDRLYLRPSGTEPKIKFYIMVQEKNGSLAEKKSKAKSKTESFLKFINAKAEQA
ncbi:MAG: phospho-sugar mutase [bacterium]